MRAVERIGEPIRVAAVFEPGRPVRPVWFDWQRRKHTVTRVTYCWQGRAGEHTLLYFAVSDGSDLFELVYDTVDQGWTLDGVEAN